MGSIPSVPRRRVTIVGGGYSGATAAVQLVRASRAPLAITIVEPRREVGPGLAHSADDPDHRLNAPTDLHFVDPSDPEEFQRWCAERRIAEQDPDAVAPDGSLYVRRKDFGTFIAEAVRAHATWPTGSTIDHLRDLATDASFGTGLVEVRTARNQVISSDLLILATGNSLPRLPADFDPALSANPAVVAVPTDLQRVRGIPTSARVLVLGSGLTALDILSTLLRSGHQGPITSISRRGLRPRPNLPKQRPLDGVVAPGLMQRIEAPVASFILEAGDPPTTRSLLRALRQRIGEVEAAGHSWHVAFDELRNVVWQVWPGLALTEKRRFLKRLRPWWDAHRFRAPPQNDAMVREAERLGLIDFKAARLRAASQEPDGRIRVELSDRDTGSRQVLHFDAVINCTGLDASAGLRENPFLAALQQRGHLCPDGSGLGFAVDQSARAIGSDGYPRDALRVLGPPTAGIFGDPTGVVFIAAQIRRVIPSMLAALGADLSAPAGAGNQVVEEVAMAATSVSIRETGA
jgi:uncharacterized NAD(P)/FAD-binding protein YdhS